MVKLEEVPDEEFIRTTDLQTEDDDDFTDTDSEISVEDEYDLDPSETILDRVYALRDMVPPTTRRKIISGIESTVSWTKKGLWFGGKAIFILSTSALLIAVPLGVAIAEENQIAEIERSERMRDMGNEMLSQDVSQNERQ